MTESSSATPDPTPPGPGPARDARPARFGFKAVVSVAAVAALAAGVWFLGGKRLWTEYRRLQEEVRANENSAPVGYRGLNYRRSYNDRPAVFHAEKDGRALLFAARGDGPAPDYYDVTDAAIDVKRLDGGYGRDSIPGVDAPLFEPPDGPIGRNLRARQPVIGLAPAGARGARAYPQDLLEKVEVVNDTGGDGGAPFAVIYDRGRGRALVVDRVVGGAAVTFGTSGYSYDRHPVLYDRKTRSLWVPDADALVCVNGPSRGVSLPRRLTPEAVEWQPWKARYPATAVLVGNDREKPIPAE